MGPPPPYGVGRLFCCYTRARTFPIRVRRSINLAYMHEQTLHFPGIEVRIAPLDVPEVVSFSGMFRLPYGLGLSREDSLCKTLIGMTLDKGTSNRSREAFAEAVEYRGASLSFLVTDSRVSFSGRCLKVHLADVLDLAADALQHPLFDDAEILRAQKKVEAAHKESLTDPADLALLNLSRTLYAPGHPAWSDPYEVLAEQVLLISPSQVRERYHAFGKPPITLVLAGDVAGLDIPALIACFGARTDEDPHVEVSKPKRSPGETRTNVEDRDNFEVVLGLPLPILRDDPDFLPLQLATFALGGNFSARLMQTVRDEEGLTYGIGARLESITPITQGHLEITVSLSPEHVERGIARTLEEVARWAEHGLDAQELERNKTTLVGLHVVDLGTTGGLATAHMGQAVRGKAMQDLHNWPARLRAVPLERVQEVLRRHIDPKAFHISIAGPFNA